MPYPRGGGNFKTGAWMGALERLTRNAYNRQWRQRHPGYHAQKSKEWNENMKKTQRSAVPAKPARTPVSTPETEEVTIFEPLESLTAHDLAKYLMPFFMGKKVNAQSIAALPVHVQANFQTKRMPKGTLHQLELGKQMEKLKQENALLRQALQARSKAAPAGARPTHIDSGTFSGGASAIDGGNAKSS